MADENKPRKKEHSKKIEKRVNKFIKDHQYKRLQIYVTDEIKNSFDEITGFENNTEKLKSLIDCWNQKSEWLELKLELEKQLILQEEKTEPVLKKSTKKNKNKKTPLKAEDENEIFSFYEDADLETEEEKNLLTLRGVLEVVIENNSSFVRMRKKALKSIEDYVLNYYNVKKLESGKYNIYIKYEKEEELEDKVYSLFQEIENEADMRNCHIEYVFLGNRDKPDQSWD